MTLEEANKIRSGDRVIVDGNETTVLSISMRGVHSPYFRVLNGGGSLHSHRIVNLPKEVPAS